MTEASLLEGLKLALPPNWIAEEEDGLFVIFSPDDGVGVLQVSMALRSSQHLPHASEAADLAKQFAAGRGWNLTTSSVVLHETPGGWIAEHSAVERGQGEATFWQAWHMVTLRRSVLVTYNSALEDSQVEVEQRHAIVASLRL